ncbi:site-specific integrase [Psychromonas aquatilis]|uniref:Site-specific integrase n=1 Tax=Psychromonas aquatilis TaxID=2005072 RepID=A0ABU9GRV2_9GAMM
MYEYLDKGLAIYRQNHTKSFYVRLRIDKKEIRRSLSVSDISEARSLAWRFKFKMEGKKMAGIPILATKELTINQAFKEVIKELDSIKVQKPIYDDYRLVITNFIIPYFKNKTIQDLTSKNIRLYFESLDLSLTRKRINTTCFKKLFQYLEEEDYIKKSEIPSLPKIENNKVEVRDAFTEKDHRIIMEELKEFHKSGKPNFKTKEYRKTLYYYFIFLCETGVRAGEEVKNLLFSDIEKENRNCFLKITKGKTKAYSRARNIALSYKALSALLEIARIQNPEKELTIDNFTNIKKPILEASFGQMPCYVKVFNLFMKYLKSNNIIKNHYTLYSCRHFYITQKLQSGIDIYVLAKYVGNSVEMIQKHYDHHHIAIQENIDKLTGIQKSVVF